ncbi:MAG: T9SS type A sorting domain-containing protein [Aequorivita sp.]
MARILLFLFLLISLSLSAQDGSVDTSFGNNGFAITDFFGGWDRGSSIGVQEDGKIVVFGFVFLPNGGVAEGLVRYLPDGSLDTSFGTDGLVTTPAGDNYYEYFNSLHIQPDQKIITSTTFMGNGETDFSIVRYLPNGQLDSSFGDGGVVQTNVGEDYLAATILLPDGKILAAGRAITGGKDNNMLLVRYLPDGSLDPSFGSGGILEEYINDETLKVFPIKVQEDGKIIVPYFTVENFIPKIKVARYLPDGFLDVSFGSDGIVAIDFIGNLGYIATAIQNDGKILHSYRRVGGDEFYIVRMLPDGSPDPTFGNDGSVEVHNPQFTPLKLLQQEDDKVILFGITYTFEPDNNLTYRFNLDGTMDTSFGNNGKVSLLFEGADIALQENGKILIAGTTFFYNGDGVDFVVARLNNGLLQVPDYEMPSFTIYPNPSSGIFTIQQTIVPENRFYQISDVMGRIIASGELNESNLTIDLSKAQSGVYFLKTHTGTLRLVKN